MEQYLKPLHLACHADDMRPNFRLIEIANGIAQASNGHIIVKLALRETSQLTEEQITMISGKYIDMEVWKEIHKCDQVDFDETTITCWKNGIKKMFEYGEPVGEFFKLDTVITQIRESGEDHVRAITYNPKLISIIHKIFQEDKLTFSFSPTGKGTVVFPYQESGMFAILMPMSCDPAETNRYFL